MDPNIPGPGASPFRHGDRQEKERRQQFDDWIAD